MKKTVQAILLIAFIACCQGTHAQEAQAYTFGLGVRLSNASPTLNNSISGKYFLNGSRALEGLLSFGNRFGIGGLYEVHQPMNFPGLQWYYGAGAYVGFQSSNTYFGPTGTIGLDYKFAQLPINLSLDWKPELDILPKISFIPDAFGLSARFTFR